MTTPLRSYMRAHRKRLALSQRELAFLLGLRTRSAVAQHEVLARIPNAKLLLKYEALFGRPVGDLMPAVRKEAEAELVAQAAALKQRLETADDVPSGRKLEVLAELIERLTGPRI